MPRSDAKAGGKDSENRIAHFGKAHFFENKVTSGPRPGESPCIDLLFAGPSLIETSCGQYLKTQIKTIMKLTPLLLGLLLSGTLLQTTPLIAKPFGLAYNADGQLFSFDLTNPANVLPVGTPVGPNVKGIDTRPGTSTLYSLEVDMDGATVQVFTVDPTTGARTPVGAAIPASGTAGDMNPYAIDLNSSGYGLDFNPTTLQGDGSSRFRLVTAEGQNFRFNSATGAVTNVDGMLGYSDMTSPNFLIGAAAYTNSDTERMGGGAIPTLLYYLDSANDNLVQSPAANSGQFTLVGSLGANITAVSGFDIYSENGNQYAYVVATTDAWATFQLFTVDLTTGALSPSFGTFPAGFEPMGGFAIVDLAEPELPAGATGFGYSASGQFFSFPLDDPSSITPIGNPGQDEVKGIDFRPGTTELYTIAVGDSTAQLSMVNVANGNVTPIGPGFPNMGTGYTISPLSRFGFDFNPTTLQGDGSIRIRFVDSNGTNLRLHSDTGGVASVDGGINIGGMPVGGVSGAAYTNSDTSRAGANPPPTRLYYLDPAADRLLTSPAANAGTSSMVGDLGLDAGDNTGFDILSFGGYNTAYVVINLGGIGTYTLHTVDLQTGAISGVIGVFPDGFAPVNGFATAVIPPVPVDTIRPDIFSKAKLTVSPNRGTVVIRGRATDNIGVDAVFLKKAGRPFVRVRGTTEWRKKLRLDPGRNVFRAYATDAAGNRSQVIRIRVLRTRANLSPRGTENSDS